MDIKINIDDNFVPLPSQINLGNQGELNARTIVINAPDISGADSYKLRLEYPNGDVYDLPLVDGKATIGGSLLLISGEIKMQWIATKSNGDSYDLVAKSAVFWGTIDASISSETIPVPPYELAKDASDKVLAIDESIKNAIEIAPQIQQKMNGVQRFSEIAEEKADYAWKAASKAEMMKRNAESAAKEAADIAEELQSSVDQLDMISTDLSDIISKTGKVYTLTPRVGYSIISNVSTGSFTFSENEDRMYCQFRSDNDFTVSRISTRVALITVNSEGRCVASTGWTTADISVEANADYTYYLLCDFTDESLIPTVAVSSSIDEKIDDIQGKITAANTDIISLRQRNIANSYGYNDVISLSWEMGSINTGNGSNTNSGTNVIRMPKPASLENDVQIIITSSNLRVRPYKYSSDGTSYVEAGAWYKGEINKLLTVDTDCAYRFQIATVDGSDIDFDDAMSNVIFAYSDDTLTTALPGYWTEYLEEKVKTINSLLTDGKDKTAFLFLTDTHWNESKTALNGYGINTLAMQYIRDRCNIDYLVHGGDLNSEYRSNRDIARQMMTKSMAMMKSVFPHVLVTRGNHDDNIEGSGNVWSYVITQSDSYSYMFRNTPDAHFGKTGTYFYHDVEFEKVRYICLDSTDMVYSNSVDESKCDQKILAYGYDQLQWLCDTLKNTPDGYSIIIYNHAMLAPSIVTVEHGSSSPQTRARNYLVLCNLLKAFKNRQNYRFDTTGYFPAVHNDYYEGVLSADFTDCNADIVAVFSGHEHVDCIEEILDSSGNGIGIYNTCTQNSSAMFGSSVLSSSYQSNMEIGTTTELVWDVVVVNRANRHVVVRIGAGAQSVRSFDF